MVTGSKKQILELIKRNGAVMLDQAVKSTGLARTTLREHFFSLEQDGYIARSYVRNGPGRPGLQYRLTSKGNSLYPSSEPDLIKKLLKFLKDKGSEPDIEEFFSLFWDRRLETAFARMDEASETDIKKRLIALTEMLEEEGFMPEYKLTDDKIEIKECNCPFSEVIKETRLPCQLEAIFFEKLFSARKTNRTTYMAEGDTACTYEVIK